MRLALSRAEVSGPGLDTPLSPVTVLSKDGNLRATTKAGAVVLDVAVTAVRVVDRRTYEADSTAGVYRIERKGGGCGCR